MFLVPFQLYCSASVCNCGLPVLTVATWHVMCRWEKITKNYFQPNITKSLKTSFKWSKQLKKYDLKTLVVQSTAWARETKAYLKIPQWKIARKESALEEVRGLFTFTGFAVERPNITATPITAKSSESHSKRFRAAYTDKLPFYGRIRSTLTAE